MDVDMTIWLVNGCDRVRTPSLKNPSYAPDYLIIEALTLIEINANFTLIHFVNVNFCAVNYVER